MAELDTTVTGETATLCRQRSATVMTWDGLVDRGSQTLYPLQLLSSNPITVALCYLMS